MGDDDYSVNIDGLTVGGSILSVADSSYATPTYTFDTTGSITLNPTYTDFNNFDSDITVAENADIKLGNKSLKEFMNKMEQRLAILQPDPEKLEKFDALKKAYEHYKTVEAMCFDEIDDDN
jgi:hypothetical protein